MPFDFSPVVADPHLKEIGVHTDEYLFNYVELSRELIDCEKRGDEARKLSIIRAIAPEDMFFLLYFVMDFTAVNHPFVLARIRDVQNENDMTVDLWARGHFKSSIITYALPIWLVLKNRDERIGIFSNTRALSTGHLRRIKGTLEMNTLLHGAFPDMFYDRPMYQAPKWSEEVGLFIKRKKVFQEATFEAWGIVDNLPTGKHFTRLIYDDIIDTRNVSTPAQIEKTTYFFQQSLNLVADKHKKCVVGTRYSLKDTYSELIKNNKWKVRVFPGEVDEKGHRKRGGTPVYWTSETLEEKLSLMGEFIFSAQILQHPVPESDQKLNPLWIKYYTPKTRKPTMNYYILVDPATSKRKDSDYTVMMVVGVDALRNYWLLDMVRDRLDLGERWEKLSGLVKSWGVTEVGYEEYAAMADIEALERFMIEDGVFFTLIKLGGKVSKTDRIKTLVPDFQKGRWILPDSIVYRTVGGEMRDLITDFKIEYETWIPGRNIGHDDMLDAMARIHDSKMNVIFPTKIEIIQGETVRNDPLNIRNAHPHGSWMASG